MESKIEPCISPVRNKRSSLNSVCVCVCVCVCVSPTLHGKKVLEIKKENTRHGYRLRAQQFLLLSKFHISVGSQFYSVCPTTQQSCFVE